MIRGYDWPGNVRELRNALERTLVLSTRDELDATDLPAEIRERTVEVSLHRPRRQRIHFWPKAISAMRSDNLKLRI